MTLAKVRNLLSKLATALGLDEDLLARAQRRYLANRKRAFKAHNQQVQAQKLADSFRAKAGEGKHVAYWESRAAHEDRVAGRKGHVANKNHLRAEHFLGVIKDLQARVKGVEDRRAELEAELKKLHHVTISGNKATGGTPRERLKAVALRSSLNCSRGIRNNFYSQTGEFDAKHCITGPAYGHRDDCSSWFASVYYSAGLPDPSNENYTAGYTGTLEANGKQVSHPKPGDAVLYGDPGATHHVEMYVGPGDKTIGHGSSPVDPGVIDLFGDGNYRFFTFVK